MLPKTAKDTKDSQSRLDFFLMYQLSTSQKTCSSLLSTTTPASFPVNRASQHPEPYRRLFQNQLKTSKNAIFTANSTPDYMANGLRAKIPSGQLKPNEIDTRNPPIFHQAAPNARPAAYSPLLTPLPLILHPHCLAHKRLRLWKPLMSHINQGHANLPEEDINHIFDVMANAWSQSTHGAYSSGLLVWHVYCDKRSVPESLWAPAHHSHIASFIASLVGTYSALLFPTIFMGSELGTCCIAWTGSWTP